MDSKVERTVMGRISRLFFDLYDRGVSGRLIRLGGSGGVGKAAESLATAKKPFIGWNGRNACRNVVD